MKLISRTLSTAMGTISRMPSNISSRTCLEVVQRPGEVIELVAGRAGVAAQVAGRLGGQQQQDQEQDQEGLELYLF